MKKLLQALLVVSSLTVTGAHAEVYGNRTFLAHRDDLSNAGMAWSIDNHYPAQTVSRSLGATLTISPFYKQSHNDQDVAKLFGDGTKGATVKGTMTVAPAVAINAITPVALFGQGVDHVPNSDLGTDNAPMSGVITLKPERSAWGARLDWHQDLSNLLKGLSLHVGTVVEEVSSHAIEKTALSKSIASDAKAIDGGAGNTVLDYFLGNVSKNSTHVHQSKLAKGRLNYEDASAPGIGDISFKMRYEAYNKGRFNVGVAGTVVVPTGTSLTGDTVFEPVVGNRGHFAVGATVDAKVSAWNKKDLSVAFNIVADWRYFLEGSETRTPGIMIGKTGYLVPLGRYNLAVQHENAGIFPATHVLTQSMNVKPGHQFDGVAGISAQWKDFTFDIGYNLFLKEKEVVTMKKDAWKDDMYALAHPWYSSSTAVLGKAILGGHADATDADFSNKSPFAKHGNKIGSNGDASSVAGVSFDPDDTLPIIAGDSGDMIYPGGYVSSGGPIQTPGKTTSSLPALGTEYSIATTKGATSGDSAVKAGETLAPAYQVAPSVCVTESQLTHSIVGGMSYKLKGAWPVIFGLGGQYEFADSSSNSALASWQVWGKIGFSF